MTINFCGFWSGRYHLNFGEVLVWISMNHQLRKAQSTWHLSRTTHPKGTFILPTTPKTYALHDQLNWSSNANASLDQLVIILRKNSHFLFFEILMIKIFLTRLLWHHFLLFGVVILHLGYGKFQFYVFQWR